VSYDASNEIGEYTTSGATVNADLITGVPNPGSLDIPASVPEPSTWAMLFAGLVLLVGLQRITRKA